MPEPVSNREAKIEAALCKAALDLGGMAVKTEVPGRRGFPDRLVILPDRPMFLVELKRPHGGRLSNHQIWWRAELMELGVVVEVVRNLEDIERVLKR